MQDIVDFVTSELGCPPSRVAKLDAFPGNAVYDVDAGGRGLIVKASTNHGALRAEAWVCARAAAEGCAAPAILRFGRLSTDKSAVIMSRVHGEPVPAEHPAFKDVGANLRRLHGVRMTGFGWLAQGSWDEFDGVSAEHPSWLSFLRAICDDTRGLAAHYRIAAVVADAAESAINEHAGTLGAPKAGVLCHGDLKAGHILVDGGRLAGVIDWGDALSGDPWFDIARFAHRSPEASLSSLLRGYRPASEAAWKLPLYEALWMLVDACVAHRHEHRVDATLREAMNYLSAMT
jgi:aminoglycoside phosphotransferase (APT) family kinase protein